MGDIQTYFYLALISLVMVTLTLLFIGIIFRSLRRRQAGNPTPLVVWLIGAATTVAFLFIVLGTVGVLYGFIRYGAS